MDARRRTYSLSDLRANDFQPRFAIWLRVTDGGTAFDYMQWVNRHVARYRAETGIERISDHDALDVWLEANAIEGRNPTEAQDHQI